MLLETLEKLTKLQHLDLSKYDPDETMGMQSFLDYSEVLADKEFLERLLPSLPNLNWLDLSGLGFDSLVEYCYLVFQISRLSYCLELGLVPSGGLVSVNHCNFTLDISNPWYLERF